MMPAMQLNVCDTKSFKTQTKFNGSSSTPFVPHNVPPKIIDNVSVGRANPAGVTNYSLAGGSEILMVGWPIPRMYLARPLAVRQLDRSLGGQAES